MTFLKECQLVTILQEESNFRVSVPRIEVKCYSSLVDFDKCAQNYAHVGR